MQYEYKVLLIEEPGEHSTGFGPRGNCIIDPEGLEKELNNLGDQGWQVVSALNIHKHEKYLILRREKTA
ncbi:MAG: hypothetical protein COT36_02555 [Parcubacteria group bacterium CG08_land_8_20_14_0_20_38_56]|nr:MAG: hypothetical protein COT36_02555 [Parcubacteria group bacterium CG08_land_8_20_14_0_20_38_56]